MTKPNHFGFIPREVSQISLGICTVKAASFVVCSFKQPVQEQVFQSSIRNRICLKVNLNWQSMFQYKFSCLFLLGREGESGNRGTIIY